MAQLTPQDVSRTGLAIATSTPTATTGDTVQNNGAVFLYVNNGGGAPITVTVSVYQQVDSQAVTPRTVSVPNGAARYIGPFPPAIYNDPATGLLTFVCSAVASVTVAALRLPSN